MHPIRLPVNLIAALLCGCVDRSTHHTVYLQPQTMTWKDGEPAYYMGPFSSKHSAFKGLSQSCQGQEYDLLDMEDEGSDETHGGSVLIGRVAVSRTRSEHDSEIYVTYRCKAHDPNEPALTPVRP